MTATGQPADPPPPDRIHPATATPASGADPTPADAVAAAAGPLPGVLVAFGTTAVTRFPVGRRVPLPRVGSDAAPPTALDPSGRRPSPVRRRIALVAAAVLAVVVALAAVAAVRGSSGPGPRDLVEDFFAALTARDTTGLRAGGRCASNPLCGAGALRSGYQPPEQVRIDGGRTPPEDRDSSKQRLVQVSYDLDGHRVTEEVRLSYQRAGLFGGRWSIIDPPGATITVPGPTLSVTTLAAVALPAVPADLPLIVWAPPGRYTVARAATPLLEPAEVTVTVTGDPPPPVTFPAVVKAAVVDEVNRQVRDRIDDCAAQRSFTPDTDPSPISAHSCPLRHSSAYTITDKPRWTVEQYPHIRLDPAADGTITVTTTTPGRATVHYRWTFDIAEPRDWHAIDATEDILITGQVTAARGTPEWTPS
jgi:hypothetical protein